MSDEHDSWFQNVFGVDLGGAAKRIEDEARAAAKRIEEEARAAQAQVTNVVQTVQKKVDGAIDDVVGAVSGVAKKVAEVAGGGGAGGGGLRAGGPGGPAGGGTGKFPLSGSVGRGGQNVPNDVKAVQRALGIGDDGKCGNGTITAIENFQRSIGQAKPDGRVDAGGATERALAGGAKPAPKAASGDDASDDILGKALAGAKSLAGAVAGGLGGAGGGLSGKAIELGKDLGGGLAGGLSGGLLGDLGDGVSSLADKVQKGLASIDPKSLRMDSGGAFSGGGSPSNDNTSSATSADFQQGFKDGKSGLERNPGPRAGDAQAEYLDGYEKGLREFQSQAPSGPQSADFKQGFQDGLKGLPLNPAPRSGGALVDYNEGYGRGKAEFEKKDKLRSASGEHYKAGFVDGLRGFDPKPGSRSDDALDDYNQGYEVGHKEFLDKSPRTDEGDSGDITDIVVDVLKSKGMVAIGERAGKAVGKKAAEKVAEEAAKKAIIGAARKGGGVIGWAIDFATSPGGDVVLPHTIYQAVITTEKSGFGIPVPGAIWHRKRENAERDAQNYTLQTGEATDVEEQFSKDSDDPE